MAVRTEMRALCLCDGYGGFELGLRAAGTNLRTVARVERDSYAAAVLVARMEETRLDQAPIWDDLTTFDGAAWRGCVDIITAGFPCQPFSAAGQRKGTDDDRWLWPAIGRIIRDVGPSFVFLENAPGLVRAGLPHALADLADLGFDAEWGLLSASDVGAPHQRQRFWLVAALAGGDSNGRLRVGASVSDSNGWLRTDDPDRSSGSDVGHAGSTRRPEVTRGAHGDEGSDAGWSSDGGNVADGASQDVADTRDDRRSQQGQSDRPGAQLARPVSGCASMGFPPRPDDHDGWAEWIAQGGPEPSVRRSADGRPVGLADALHLGGNGLVPTAAAEAFIQLIDRLGVTT